MRERQPTKSLFCLACICLLAGFSLVYRQETDHRGLSERRSWDLVGMRFAIADLDGDRKPDLASVESETQQAGGTSYAIRVQSSTGADSHIGVLGPVGGMRLALRDVNGDKNLDLVLTSVINHRVIQVLLNDGRGNFSPAEADQNVAAPAEVEQSWSNREPSREDGAGSTNSRWSFDRGSFGITIADPKPDMSLGKSEWTARAWGHARLRHGRAPPTATQQS